MGRILAQRRPPTSEVQAWQLEKSGAAVGPEKIVPVGLNQSIDFPQDYGTLWLGFHVQGAFPAIWMRGLQTPRCWGHDAAEIGAGMFPTTELLAWEGCKKDMSLQGHGNFVIFFTYYFTSEPIPATKE